MRRPSRITEPGQAGFDFSSRARAADPETSKAAAAAAGDIARRQHAEILAALRTHGSLTYHEIAARLWLPPVSVGRRMGELEAAGLVAREIYTRPSPSGRACTVWAVAHRGVNDDHTTELNP